MVHRGPDDFGTWTDERAGIAIGHRRLSIIDLSAAGHQPMLNDDGTKVLVYNGEIYDFQNHRAALEKEGAKFRSRSDTEVILRLYERFGLDAISRLNGMFAFALWDSRTKQLLLARDHAGIKPLYYFIDGGHLYFASEIKALLAVPGVPRRLNLSAVRTYLSLLWVPGGETMLEGIRKLEPGHYLIWQDGRVQIRRWFELDYKPDQSLSEADWVESIRDTFVRVTRRQMVADVPLGAFLSGGLDSSSIAACMRAAYPDRSITAYTARFTAGAIAAEQGVDDYPYAERVARHLGIKLHSIPIEPDVVSLLPRMVYHLDEPDADPAVFPSYLISAAARANGCTVLLSGTGGDEVFFGYRSHQAMRQYQRFEAYPRAPLRAALTMLSGASNLLAGRQHRLVRRVEKFRRGFDALPGIDRHLAVVDWSDPRVRQELLADGNVANAGAEPDLRNLFAQIAQPFRGRGEINLHSFLLINTFLAAHNLLYTDKSSMAASLEVRVPFLDLELLRLAARIPEALQLKGGTAKYLLKKAMEPQLPHEVINRSKTGFGVPLRRWIRRELAGSVRDLLSPEAVRRRGLFSHAAVTRLVQENASGKADRAYLIYALLVFEIWARTFLDQAGVAVELDLS